MTAKEYLKQLRRADMIINQRIRERDNLKGRLADIGSPDYSRERVRTSPAADARYERGIARVADIEAEIGRMIDSHAALRHRIIGEIQSLGDDRHVEILYRRYVEGEGFGAIAAGMGYTYQYVVVLHGRALKEFSEKIPINC